MNSTFKPGRSEAINVTFSKSLFKILNENALPNQEYIFGLNLGQGQLIIAQFNSSLY